MDFFVSGVKVVYKASRTRNLVIKLSSVLILVLDYQVPFHPLARHSSLISPQADTGIIYFFLVRCFPTRTRASSITRFLDRIQLDTS